VLAAYDRPELNSTQFTTILPNKNTKLFFCWFFHDSSVLRRYFELGVSHIEYTRLKARSFQHFFFIFYFFFFTSNFFSFLLSERERRDREKDRERQRRTEGERLREREREREREGERESLGLERATYIRLKARSFQHLFFLPAVRERGERERQRERETL
jgi:hypothetical protein